MERLTTQKRLRPLGIWYISAHSGRGGVGTDSYFDDILITATQTTPTPQLVIFADDFEYDDSLENHGWIIEYGNPHTAMDPENADNWAAYIQSTANTGIQLFYHSFNELQLQPGMQLSIRFYDTGANYANCDVHTYVFFDDNSRQVEVGWYNNPSSFEYSYDFTSSWSGHLYETYGLRGIRWHTFTWRVDQSGGIDLLIDGKLIIDDLMGPGNSPVVTLSKFRVNAGSDPYTYSFSVDDFLVTRDGVPVSVEASIDFDPDTLNLKSKGKWVTVYTELPAGYDVTDINVVLCSSAI